jgi:hypothetical protein
MTQHPEATAVSPADLARKPARCRLFEAIKAVKRAGRRLSQRAMYFEVAGYDGVQILRIE